MGFHGRRPVITASALSGAVCAASEPTLSAAQPAIGLLVVAVLGGLTANPCEGPASYMKADPLT